MLEQLMGVALKHIQLTAIEAFGYAATCQAEWLPGYEGRHAAVWEEGDRSSITVWGLSALGMVASPITIDCKGRIPLWGRQGGGRYRMGLTKLYDLLAI